MSSLLTPGRGLVLAGTALTFAFVAVDIARHPALLRDPQAAVYVAVIAVALGGYVAATLLATREAGPLGAAVGLVVICLWAVELWVANLAPSGGLTDAVYWGSIAGVFVATFAGGFLGGRLRGRIADGASAGVLSGMLGGMFVCVALASVGIFDPTLFASDPQTIAEFHRSGTSDLVTFLAGDALAGGVNHLLIGLIVGSLGGLAAGAVGAATGAGPRPAAARG